MFLYTLLYLLFCFFLIFPPVEFATAGLTISAIFANYLGSEAEQFVLYHIKRTTLNMFAISLMPCGWFVGLYLFEYYGEVGSIAFAISLVFPGLLGWLISRWWRDGWKSHPIAVKLAQFTIDHSDWSTVASDINREYRR